MKVTKAQVQENRERIVKTASVLFRERGYDGVGIAELMSSAGLTHGGFYKHFTSKADLMAEAAAFSFAKSATETSDLDMVTFTKQYLSREHRDSKGEGCTMAALCTDAGRQSESIKDTFLTGIESQLATLASDGTTLTDNKQSEARANRIATIAQIVGAMVLSRACPDDSALADEILQVCHAKILGEYNQETE